MEAQKPARSLKMLLTEKYSITLVATAINAAGKRAAASPSPNSPKDMLTSQ